VKDVAISDRLVDSPVCLVAPENDIDIHMQRVLKKSQGYEGSHQHILEVNANHPVIKKLAAIVTNDTQPDVVRDTALLLLDQARIVEGEPLTNPADFVRRMSVAMEKGLLAG
jgi:molecular chaperone HtpG